VIAPGYVPSGENETGPIGGGLRQYAFGAAPGQSLHAAFATGYFGGFVFEKADWDFRKFDFDKDLAFARKKLGAMMDATNPDLSAFQKRGGKLIHYHGLLDGSIPPAMSTRYYDKVVAKVGTRTATLDFYRLFLAPGVLHCGYGPGPNSFGNIGPRGPADADHDTLLALERWVEQGVAPAKIIATKYVDDEARKGVQMTRPLCAYPQVARWMGKGQATDAMSFSCVDEK
jgi:feruloyl esterase